MLDRIRGEYDAHFDPDQPVAPIKWEAIGKLIPRDVPTAVVHYSLTGERGLALIVTRQGLEVVGLPELSDWQGMELAKAWYEGYYEARAERRWDESLPGLLEPAAQRAVRPVVQALEGRGIQRLILVPNRAMHLFPLHACRLADGRYLADAYEVIYTPSLSILDRCAGRHRQQRRRLLAVADPTYDLAFTGIECARVRRHYGECQVLRGREATRDRLLGEFGGYHVWHYSGHGTFNLGEPLASALVLKDKCDATKWLTLRDIFCGLHLPENLLVVMGGCETAMLRPDRIDEYVGLPSGFLYAGAACVVSSLWVAGDLCTCLLMDRFHEEWHAGRSIGAALRECRRWVREEIVSGEYLREEVLDGGFLASLDDDEQRRTCRIWGDKMAKDYPDTPPFASAAHWRRSSPLG